MRDVDDSARGFRRKTRNQSCDFTNSSAARDMEEFVKSKVVLAIRRFGHASLMYSPPSAPPSMGVGWKKFTPGGALELRLWRSCWKRKTGGRDLLAEDCSRSLRRHCCADFRHAGGRCGEAVDVVFGRERWRRSAGYDAQSILRLHKLFFRGTGRGRICEVEGGPSHSTIRASLMLYSFVHQRTISSAQRHDFFQEHLVLRR